MDINDYVEAYARCECGAITIINGGRDVSFLPKNRAKVVPGLDLRRIQQLPSYYSCNHCCNHWGLDLCACGSGLPPEECDNGHPECGTPSQSLTDFCGDYVVEEHIRNYANRLRRHTV